MHVLEAFRRDLNKRKFSPETYSTYFNSFYSLLKKTKTMGRDMKDFDQIARDLFDVIKKSDSARTTKLMQTLTLIRMMEDRKNLQEFSKTVREQYLEWKQEVTEHYKKNELSEKHEKLAKDITLSKLRERQPPKHPDRRDVLYHLLVDLDYTPRLEYRHLTYEKDKSSAGSPNFIYKDGNKYKMILKKYKTSKKYGPRSIDIIDKVQGVIDQYIKDYNIQYGQHFFFSQSRRDETMPSKAFSDVVKKAMNKAVGRHINVNLLRKIKEGALLHQNVKSMTMTEEQKDKYAKDTFGHSLKMAELAYKKVPKNGMTKKDKVNMIKDSMNSLGVNVKDLKIESKVKE